AGLGAIACDRKVNGSKGRLRQVLQRMDDPGRRSIGTPDRIGGGGARGRNARRGGAWVVEERTAECGARVTHELAPCQLASGATFSQQCSLPGALHVLPRFREQWACRAGAGKRADVRRGES